MSPDSPPIDSTHGRSPASERARRKKLGIVYTPGQIAHYIAAQSISAALIPAISPEGIPPRTPEWDEQVVVRLREVLPKIRIVDPACGEGVFLLAGAILLSDFYARTLAGRITPDQGQALREQIISNSLFGFDTDEQAIAQCRKALANWAEFAGKPVPSVSPNPLISTISTTLHEHVRVTDALLEIQTPTPQFDVVICNPPYVTMTSIAAERKSQYARQYATYHANGDLYYLFLERAFSLLKPGGQLGAIVPRYFLKAPTAERLRAFLATKRCRAIDDLGKAMTFPGVGIHAMLLFFENRPPKANEKGYLRVHPKQVKEPVGLIGGHLTRNEEFPAESLGSAPWTFQSPAYQQFITQVRSRSQGYLVDYCTLSKGVQTGKDAVFVVDEATVAEHGIETGALRQWLKGRDIQPFTLAVTTPKHVIFSTLHEGDAIQAFPRAFEFLQEHEAELRQRSRVAAWYQWRKGDERVTLDWAHTKIVGRYKGHHPMFAFDTRGAYFSQDVVLVQPKPEFEQYLLFFLALLNSSVVARIAQNEFKELAYHTYEWYPQQLAKIPVILPSLQVLAQINSLLGEMLETPSQESPKSQLNDIISTLYS